jgi:hypothetical protein
MKTPKFIEVLAIYSLQENVSPKKEVLYNILNEFGTTMKLVRPIKMCLNRPYGKLLSVNI